MNKEDVNSTPSPKNNTSIKNLSNNNITINSAGCPLSPRMSKVVSSSGISAINNSISNSSNSCNTIKSKNTNDSSNHNSSETISSLTNSVKVHITSPITKPSSTSFNLKKKRNISTTAIDTLILENDPIAICEDNVPQIANNVSNSNSNTDIKEIKTSKSTLFV